jgi:hypothetical protein
MPHRCGRGSLAQGKPRPKKEGTEQIKIRNLIRLVPWAFLLGIYALGLILRWGIVECLEEYHGDLPYTMESAMLFHYADLCARGRPIPMVDRRAQYREGLEVRQKLSVGKGVVAATLYKALGRPAPFTKFVRRFDAAWFSLGILAAFLVVREMGGGQLGGVMAAAFYAVSVSSVARSTGLEFSRENFALPLIFLHWWLLLREWRRRRFSLFSVLAGGLLAVAASTWDVTQLYILLIGVFVAIRLLFGKGDHRLTRAFLPGMGCLVIAGLTVPYLRDHQFLFSWGMLVWYSLATAFLVDACFRARKPLLPKIVFLAMVASLSILVASQTMYPQTYSHFARLFVAKLRYLNVKPLNPAKLSYEARILWTPALHSATSPYLGKYPIADFELLFLLGVGPLALLLRSLFKRTATDDEKALCFWLAVYLVLYLFFVRMQVFLSFFLCCLIGLGVRYWSRLFRRAASKAAAVILWSLAVLVVLGAELHAYSRFDKIYRAFDSGSPYAADRVLVDWLRENTDQDAVILASFTLEPTIFTYAERVMVLNPKFESKRMRLKVKRYLEALFSENEKDFYDFCLGHGVDYYVLQPGVFAGDMIGGLSNSQWVYSNRYMVDRAERRPQYATLAMRDNPDRLQYFKKVTDVCLKGDPFGFFYRIFRVVSEADIQQAGQNVKNARTALGKEPANADRQSLQRAEEELLQAIELFPGSADAHTLLGTVYLLKGERNKASQEIERCKQILTDQQN